MDGMDVIDAMGGTNDMNATPYRHRLLLLLPHHRCLCYALYGRYGWYGCYRCHPYNAFCHYNYVRTKQASYMSPHLVHSNLHSPRACPHGIARSYQYHIQAPRRSDRRRHNLRHHADRCTHTNAHTHRWNHAQEMRKSRPHAHVVPASPKPHSTLSQCSLSYSMQILTAWRASWSQRRTCIVGASATHVSIRMGY